MASRRYQANVYLNAKQAGETIRKLYKERRELTNAIEAGEVAEEDYIKTVKRIREVNGIIDDHRKSLRSVESTWDKLRKAGGSFVGFAAAAFTADAVVDYGKELFKLGSQMELLNAKAETVFGQALPQVSHQAKENARDIGLTENGYRNAAAAIGDLLIPMKFSREEAADMSTELVNLSGALSEWTGGQRSATEVSHILSKAMLGEREELKSLGISILEEDVKNRLREKGLEKLTGEYLQQAKAIATVELILEKSTDAQTAFANNSETNVRRAAQLNATFEQIRENLATAFLPVLTRLADIVAKGAESFLNITKKIDGFLNPARAAAEVFDEQTQKVSDLESNLLPLLNRYDELTEKTTPTVEEQSELSKIIQQIGNITPQAIEEIDKYGQILSINAEQSRNLLEAEKARLKFVNQKAISATEKEIKGFKARQLALERYIETGEKIIATDFGGNPVRIPFDDESLRQLQSELINITKNLIPGAETELERLSGKNLGQRTDTNIINDTPEEDPTEDEILAQKARAERLAEQRKKQAEQRAKELERNQEKLNDILAKFQEARDLSLLSEEERSLEQIRIKYQKEIDLAISLEKAGIEKATEQRLELERLRDEELNALRDELSQKRIDEEVAREQEENLARLERQQKFEEEKAAVQTQITEQVRQVVYDDQELSLIQLQEHYDELIQLAQQYGIDTLDIELTYEKERDRIRKEFRDKSLKDTIEAQNKEAQALIKVYQGMASIVSNSLEFIAGESAEFTGLSKVLTFIQLGLKSAEAIASATASAAGLPFPTNLGAIVTAVAAVTANITQARKILTATPEVPQRKGGGYTDVRGADDGKIYRARYIGEPSTGLLPDYPVLVSSASGQTYLGSEAGAEYFVSAPDLKDPRVFNYVQAIDNITKYRQFRNGGFTDPATTSTTATSPGGIDLTLLMQMVANNNRLLERLLVEGVKAMIDDDFITDLRDRQSQLDKAAGFR